jgi:hypothetical protein
MNAASLGVGAPASLEGVVGTAAFSPSWDMLMKWSVVEGGWWVNVWLLNLRCWDRTGYGLVLCRWWVGRLKLKGKILIMPKFVVEVDEPGEMVCTYIGKRLEGTCWSAKGVAMILLVRNWLCWRWRKFVNFRVWVSIYLGGDRACSGKFTRNCRTQFVGTFTR